jgi:DNA-binding Xre family transcriptional regulator
MFSRSCKVSEISQDECPEKWHKYSICRIYFPISHTNELVQRSLNIFIKGLSHIATKYVSPEESMDWLRATMKKRGFTLNSLAEEIGINKGNIYRYFTQQQRPRIDVVPILCDALKATPASLLIQLGVMPKLR